MTFGHDVFQRGFAAEVLFRASDDHAEISYRSHNKSKIGGKVVCKKITSPYNVTYSSGGSKAGMKAQNYPTLKAAKAAAEKYDLTGKWVYLGDVSPSLDDCSDDVEKTCPEGQVLKFNTATDTWECAPVENGDDVMGCMDSDANNYDSKATVDDGSCKYDETGGCMDETATNYNPDATEDDSSCEYDEEGSVLNGIFLVAAVAVIGSMFI